MTGTTSPLSRTQAPPTLLRLPALLFAFLPYYLRHLLAQPYRAAGFKGNIISLARVPSQRHHIAVYDAVTEIMLRGYAGMAGHRLRPETGQVVIKLMHLGFAFDDELERRTADGQPLGFDDVFDSASVRQPLAALRAFMQQFDTDGAIMEFLIRYVATLYASHRAAVDNAERPATFDNLTADDWDSGGLLVVMAHVVGRLHAAPPSPETVGQFSSLGVTAKLADDIVDLRADLVGGRPNLLHALAREEGELAQVNAALARDQRMNTRWWRNSCPRSFARLSLVYERHHAALTSRWLRLANALMWTPALVGHSGVSDTRGRV